jgi:hypothetical protein
MSFQEGFVALLSYDDVPPSSNAPIEAASAIVNADPVSKLLVRFFAFANTFVTRRRTPTRFFAPFALRDQLSSFVSIGAS